MQAQEKKETGNEEVFLITGFVTASGGAWNASIVAEYVRFRGQTISTTGLGAIISHATDSGNFRLLLAATVVMAIMVVTINRLVWRPLYALASAFQTGELSRKGERTGTMGALEVVG